MSVSPDYLDWVLDQLGELGPVTTRRMFGAAGLYFDGVLFGIVDDDVAYFKADDRNRLDYVERGMPAFRPTPDQESTSYYEVPADVLEEPSELAEWATRSVAAAAARAKAAAPRAKSGAARAKSADARAKSADARAKSADARAKPKRPTKAATRKR